MNKLNQSLLALAVSAAAGGFTTTASADFLTELLEGGEGYGGFRLRYEDVSQDNARDDAQALTLRTKLGYKTGVVSGFSSVVELEDVRIVLGQDDFSADPAGFNPGEFSVIADAETTELHQAFVQYKAESVTAKLGRQVITLDGHRFVGHVGWRQNWQTFDAGTVTFTPSKDLSVFAGYIGERNRIFAEEADFNSSDFLLNVSYKTPVGKLVGYYYDLNEEDTANESEIETLGFSFKGSAKASDSLSILYAAEYATQEFSNNGGADADADYLLLEGGVKVSGISIKLGYEVLGSDDGAYGFSTPLATLHKFNGWADLFLGTPSAGLVDTYLSVGGKAGPGKFVVAYHEFTADEDTEGFDDLGSEWDAQYVAKFGKGYSAGVKLALYSADDHAVDTDKYWVWISKSF